MRASIQQVAQRAGVSSMTVSNVLRNRADQVSEGTRERVLLAVQELNYVPVRAAMQNRHVETRVIGVLLLQAPRGMVGHQTFQGICERATELDYDLLVHLRDKPDWMRSGNESHFLDRRCDGFIFVAHQETDLARKLAAHRVPLVECYVADTPPGMARILPDNISAMRLAVEYLLALGHTRIAHLAGPLWNSEATQRRESFRNTMRAHGHLEYGERIVQGNEWGNEDGAVRPAPETRPLVEAVLAMDVTAVVCANDFLALDLWSAAEEKGRRIPEDLSITGMDNTSESGHRGLTSIAVPFEKVGRCAVEALSTLLQGGETEATSVTVPVSLIARGSVRALS